MKRRTQWEDGIRLTGNKKQIKAKEMNGKTSKAITRSFSTLKKAGIADEFSCYGYIRQTLGVHSNTPILIEQSAERLIDSWF